MDSKTAAGLFDRLIEPGLTVDGVVPDGRRDDQGAYRDAIRAFADVASALGQVSQQDDLLHLVGRKICELVQVQRCSVYLRDDKTGLYYGKVGHDDHDIDPRVRTLICGTPADGFTREIIDTQAPVVIENVLADPRPVRSAMRSWHVMSMMGVPMILSGEVIGIIFLDSADVFRRFTPIDQALASAFADLAAVAIAQSRLYNELRASHDTVARQNDALRRAAAVDEQLTNLVLSGRNLREIAAAVAEMTHKPCALHDADGRRLALAMPAGSDESHTPSALDPAYAVLPPVAEALAALTSRKVAVVGPFPQSGLNYRFLIAPVTVRDVQWGSLVLVEKGSRFNNFDMLISRRTASIVALELSAERRAANAEWNARASLASELIRGNRDSDQLDSRAQFLGITLDGPHVLVLLTARGDDDMPLPDARTVADQFRRVARAGTVIATGVAEGIAVIVEVPDDEAAVPGVARVKATAAEVCAALSPDAALVAGISTICRGPADFVRAYAHARQVVGCIEQFCPPGRSQILAADDLGAGRLLLASSDPREAECFATDTLGRILGDGASGDLLLTLSCFFEQDRSVRRSATVLSVHENTIRYRLGRIEELTGLAVATDAAAQLSVQMALLVLRLQGRLPVCTDD